MNDSVVVFEHINSATLTASAGSAADYPLTNLQDGRIATQWKSGANTINQTLIIELPSPIYIAHIFFVNHNFFALGVSNITVSYSSDGVTYTGEIAIPSLNPDPLSLDLTSAVKKYTKITFNKASGSLSTQPMIGMIFLGRKANLPLYLNNPKRGLKAEIVRDESLSGLRFRSSSFAERQTWALDYSVKQLNNSEILRWLKGIGVGLHPFWIKDMDDNWHFVGLDTDSVEGSSKGNVSFDYRNLRISEERVGKLIQLPGGYSI
jgi:hypothetical protein